MAANSRSARGACGPAHVSASGARIRQKLDVTRDLHGVVRSMKAVAASSIGRYERAASALAEYDQAVKLGLAAALREIEWRPGTASVLRQRPVPLNAIVFGSDQGLVGQFNDVIAEFAVSTLRQLPGPAAVWAVGERVYEPLAIAGLNMREGLSVPSDVTGIRSLVGSLQVKTQLPGSDENGEPLYVFYNRRQAAGGYEPVTQRLLPLDAVWRDELIAWHWPRKTTPELLEDPEPLFRGLVREHLFISLFQACAASLTSENASRLAAMQRAEKNIAEMVRDLTYQLHRVRQVTIDQELFDVVSGFEALN